MQIKLTLRQRIALSAGVLVFFVFVTGLLGYWHAQATINALNTSRNGVVQVNQLAALEASWHDVSRALDSVLIAQQTAGEDGELSEALATFNEALAALPGQAFGMQSETVNANAQTVANLQFLGGGLNDTIGSIQREVAAQRWDEAERFVQRELLPTQQQFEETLETLRQESSAEIDALVGEAVQRQQVTSIYLAIGLALAVASGVAFTVLGVRAIVEPITQLIERTRRVTEGDFSYVPPLNRDDEIGQLAGSFSIMTEWLADSYQVLEERVEERTRELALAAEVGRRLGRVHDIDELLKEAVELIRRRFDLYYTQVYLVSKDGRSLEMRAGTGDVGDELRRRGFRLPIDRGSVNGSAAYERRPVVISDAENSSRFRRNALLPETLAEIAMPLLSGERVVGVLDLQSSRRYGLSEDNLAAFEVLAGQLAIAIENAMLFSEIAAARAELEVQAQARISENWATFMNAIERPERLAYTYQGGVLKAEPKQEPLEAVGDNSLHAPIALNEVKIGHIRLKAQPQQRWSNQDVEVVEDIAHLVAQQVENLRLLAEAQRYRAEAEEALQRLTRESWKSLQAEVGAYHYDGRQVNALLPEEGRHEIAYPLQVRDQTVGELLVGGNGAGVDSDAAELVSVVADRLSTHLEQLRLTRQTEEALSDVQRRSEELEDLNRIVTRIAGTLELSNSLQIVVDELVALTAADQARIGLLAADGSSLTIVSEAFDPSMSPSALGLTIPVEGNVLTEEVLSTRKTVVIQDALTHPLTMPIRGMLSEQGIRTMIVLPILAGNEVIGTVGADILTEGVAFGTEDLRLAETIVFQAATAIQNARLFEQIQATLAETRALYRASAELNRARNYDDLLEVLRQHSIAGDGSTTISLAMFERPWMDSAPPRWIDILSYWSAEAVDQPKLRFDLHEYPALSIMERDRQTIIRDVESDTRLDSRSRRALRLGFKARSVLAMPLVAGGQWIGHVNALFPEPRDFSDSELQQLLNLVGQAAVAVQRIKLLEETSRLLESEQRQRRISDALVRATSRMLGVLDEQHIRELIVEEIENLLGPDQIALFVWDRENGALVVDQWRVTRGEEGDDYRAGQRIRRGARPELWAVLESGEAHLSPVQSDDGRTRELFVMPWQVGNEVAGVVELYHSAHGSTIRDEDRASIEGIVQQAAIRLQSARLFEEAERRTAETEALYVASRTINTATSYDQVMDALCAHTVLGVASERVFIHYFDRPWREDAPPQWVTVLARRGTQAKADVPGRYALTELAGAQEILKADGVTVIADIESDERLNEPSRMRLAGSTGASGALFAPLRAGGQWLGFVEATYFETLAVGEEDVRQLMALTSQAAATVQGLHLLQQAEVRAQRERVLREITEKVRSATDVDVIMKTAVREVGRALGRDAFVKLGDTTEDEPGANGSTPKGLNGRQAD